jgi:hypothetical protein
MSASVAERRDPAYVGAPGSPPAPAGEPPRSRAAGLRRALAECAGVLAGAALLRLIAGVGFANYDTLYALLWGQQLAHGQTPQYAIPIASTPHPLVEALGLITAPLGPHAMEQIAVWLGFVALSACAWVVYRLGERWFGRAAGALAALIVITRVPIISYGVRAYIDVPYLLLVLAAVLVESRRARAGAPVLVLLALAGLLRPEAWVLSGLYWLYLALWEWRRGSLRAAARRLSGLALLGLSAPLIWLISDLLITGDALWSLTNTRHTAATLGRETGIAKVPEYIPRRVGEILRPPVLAGAALGGVLSLLWLPRRARLLAIVGVTAVAVFVVFSAAGLPINTRYAFLTAAILAIFCGAGVFGWLLLPVGDRRRRWWMAGSAAVAIALIAYAPSQYGGLHGQLLALKRYQDYQRQLVTLVDRGAITTRCGPVGVPNHAPIPLLALYLRSDPRRIVSARIKRIRTGTYVDPANRRVENVYVLNRADPGELRATVPPGFRLAAAYGSWRVFERCAR